MKFASLDSVCVYLQVSVHASENLLSGAVSFLRVCEKLKIPRSNPDMRPLVLNTWLSLDAVILQEIVKMEPGCEEGEGDRSTACQNCDDDHWLRKNF